MINKMIITNSLGSNYTGEDIKLSLSLLFQPWKWKRGKEVRLLENEIATPRRGGLPPEADRRNDVSVRLFYKGRQAIGEALKILKIGQGDEVIVQAFTCVAVVQPILEAGARPIYVDVASRSFNPPLSSIKAAVTPKTKAAILQHNLGVVNPENIEIVEWCRQKSITVIQDLAHTLGAKGLMSSRANGVSREIQRQRSRSVASGDLDSSTAERNISPSAKVYVPALGMTSDNIFILSFSQDKVVDGVSGGALITTTTYKTTNYSNHLNDWSNFNWEIFRSLVYPLLTKLIRQTYNSGVGKIIHFIAKNIGLLPSPVMAPNSVLPMPNALAALALGQFQRIDNIVTHRRKISLLYNELLISELKIISKKDILAGANLRYPIWVDNRDELEDQLKNHGYYLVDHWYDAPVSPEWVDPENVKYQPGSCPNAEELSHHIFNLPTHVNINSYQVKNLISIINNIETGQKMSKKAWPFLR